MPHLLRPRDDRPCRHAAKQGDEIASPHPTAPQAEGFTYLAIGRVVHHRKFRSSMSALGHKRTLRHAPPMSAFPPKADIAQRNRLSALCHPLIRWECFCVRVPLFYPVTVRTILVPSDCSLILPRRWFLSWAVRNHPVADLLPLSTLKPSC